jgi:hypothetical protein
MKAYDTTPLTESAPTAFEHGGPNASPEGLDETVEKRPFGSPDKDYHADEEAARIEKDPREGYVPGTIGEALFKKLPIQAMAGDKAMATPPPRPLTVREELRVSQATPAPAGSLPNFAGPPRSTGRTWTSDPRWSVGLTDVQKAAAMALMEADTRGGKPDMEAARNALGAMLNRSAKTGETIGRHVSRAIYQPTIEANQWARLNRITRSPEFTELTQLAQARLNGTVKDWVKGATHFLAHESVMLKLSGGVRPDPYNPGQFVGNSRKYYSWPKWTGFDAKSGSYRGVVFRDKSHAFLIRD